MFFPRTKKSDPHRPSIFDDDTNISAYTSGGEFRFRPSTKPDVSAPGFESRPLRVPELSWRTRFLLQYHGTQVYDDRYRWHYFSSYKQIPSILPSLRNIIDLKNISFILEKKRNARIKIRLCYGYIRRVLSSPLDTRTTRTMPDIYCR